MKDKRSSSVWTVSDWWHLELLGAAVGLAALISLIAVLVSFDSKPIPRWPWHITVGQLHVLREFRLM